jgi:hypothetical protein
MKFPDTIVNAAEDKQRKYDILRKKPDAQRTPDNDFFLEGTNGIDINILFKYNYEGDFNDNVDVDATITEKDANGDALKVIKFNKCKLGYNIADPDRLQFELSRTVKSYTSAINKNPVDIKQVFTIYLNIPRLSSASSYTPQAIIPMMTPYNSFMEYKVFIIPDNEIYSSQLYIINARAGVVDANAYMKKNLEEQNKEILRDKYNAIITPMFMVDNKLSQLEDNLQVIKDAYEFNRLNSMASQLRFYPVNQA